VSRQVSDADIQQALRDKKIAPRDFREAKRKEAPTPEASIDHPLIAQGKAMQDVAKSLGDQGRAMEGAVHEIGTALKTQGGDVATLVKGLTVLVEQNNALVRQMMVNMASMHRERMDSEENKGKTKTILIKVNRTLDRYMDTLEMTIKENK